MERHGDWHYVNRPIGEFAGAPGEGAADSGPLDKQLAALSKSVAAPGTPPPERAYALPWLIHLVGDAHQPLHTTSRFDTQSRPDRPGDRLNVRNPFNPGKPNSTLHAFWDDLPGPAWLRGAGLEAGRHLLGTLPGAVRPGALAGRKRAACA